MCVKQHLVVVLICVFLMNNEVEQHFMYLFIYYFFDEPWGCYLYVHSTWGLLSFLDLWVYSFHQIWKHFGHYFFKYFFKNPSPPLSRISSYIAPLIVSHRSTKLFIFSSLFFFLCFILNSFSGYIFNSLIISSMLFQYNALKDFSDIIVFISMFHLILLYQWFLSSSCACFLISSRTFGAYLWYLF